MNLKTKLSRAPLPVLAIYSALVIFLLYTCCYAFRKPFTIGLYEGESLWGIDLKLLYVLAEIIGYALSKIVGTYLLPGMMKHQRVFYIIGLLSFSELAWLGFGFLPEYLKFICAFLSGLPLGMIWGISFSFIEGRRISEVLNVGLSIALIISSGLVKSLGQWLMDLWTLPEYWVPFVTGAVIFPVMLLLCWMLNQIPEPTERDIECRSERLPMSGADKRKFFKDYFFGIAMLVLFYGALTVFRELRDSFAADLWQEYGISDPLIFTKTEYPIAFVVLGIMFLTVFIRNNRKALNVMYGVSVLGCLVSVGSTFAFQQGGLDPVTWMVLSGLGMYLGYIPFTYLVERLYASLRLTCTAVFLIYMADSFGYLGTAGVFVFKNFTTLALDWGTLLMYTSYITAGIAFVAIVCTAGYFRRKVR